MRELVVVDYRGVLHTPTDASIASLQGGIFIPTVSNSIPFSNAKTLLGQEFPYAIYDMRAENGVCLNLDALAIVSGTIQQGGTLYLLCTDWYNLPEQLDYDALRWNANTPIAAPNFYHYFQQLVAEFGFKVQSGFGKLPDISNADHAFSLTDEQQTILHHLPSSTADIHLITAPRGRGKSTLSGKLAEQLSANQKVLITARSHSALPNFWKQIEGKNIPFFAPDNLLQQIENKAISSNCWLFIDEAASLPLPILHRFCAYFDKVVLTTTTQNYEGTGRGFSLKFLPQLQRSYQKWQLTTPLRWGENDPLEQFINRLLLLDEKMDVCNTSLQIAKTVTRGQIPAEICKKIAFYHLLAQAHYKTTPTDLRRLFDAPDQHLFSLEQNGKLIAGCWAMNEGDLSDNLTQAIWRGERRPQGSLVAQYLCFQGNLPDACRLKSVRISRIAVQPEWQRQGCGKRLILQFLAEISPLVDFVSVSFGLNNELLRFWTDCGFHLVQITPTVEASSGYHSAMMILPCSEQGKTFAEKACQQFERDLPLQPFFSSLGFLQISAKISPLASPLDDTDWVNLHGFAYAQRSFAACYVSLKRLALAYPEKFDTLRDLFTIHATSPQIFPNAKKQWIADLRAKIRQNFPFLNTITE